MAGVGDQIISPLVSCCCCCLRHSAFKKQPLASRVSAAATATVAVTRLVQLEAHRVNVIGTGDDVIGLAVEKA